MKEKDMTTLRRLPLALAVALAAASAAAAPKTPAAEFGVIPGKVR
jgi:hypothetical protein